MPSSVSASRPELPTLAQAGADRRYRGSERPVTGFPDWHDVAFPLVERRHRTADISLARPFTRGVVANRRTSWARGLEQRGPSRCCPISAAGLTFGSSSPGVEIGSCSQTLTPKPPLTRWAAAAPDETPFPAAIAGLGRAHDRDAVHESEGSGDTHCL